MPHECDTFLFYRDPEDFDLDIEIVVSYVVNDDELEINKIYCPDDFGHRHLNLEPEIISGLVYDCLEHFYNQ